MNSFISLPPCPSSRPSLASLCPRPPSRSSSPIRSCCPPPSLNPAPKITPLYTSENTYPAWDISYVTSSSMWRLLLLSDGHLTNHLRVITSNGMTSTLLESALLPPATPPPGFHSAGLSLPEPSRRRQLRLLDPAGRVLVHATTFWDPTLYDTVFGDDERRTVWEALHESRFGTARALLGVEYGPCEALAREIGRDDGAMFWARELLLKRDGKIMAVIHEILTPELEMYIGPMTPPGDWE